MEVTIRLEGTTPLLMHNPRMVDPSFEINREIKAITGKTKKTDDDHARVETLEWFGGLYERDGVIVQPAAKVRKTLVEAGRIHKLGKHVERAVMMAELDLPLEYEGPRDPEEVFQTGAFTSRLSVGLGKKRVMRVRPQFMPWALSAEAFLLDDAGLNFDELERLADLAGRAVGIGDGRAIGYGRFAGTVTVR